MLRENPTFPNYLICSSGKVFFKESMKEVNYRFSKYGVKRIDIYDVNKTRKYVQLHNVIAATFIDNPNNHKHVKHINGDYLNNSICNLKWVNYGEFKKKAKDVIKREDVLSIDGFDNYCVSKKGEVFGKDGKLLSARNTNGYKSVCLYKNHKMYNMTVHRIVAMTFLPRKQGKEYVNHKDGNRSNNFVENLEWCTQSENVKHGFRVLGRVAAKGSQLKISIMVLDLLTGVYYESIKEFWLHNQNDDTYPNFWRKVKNNKISRIMVV